MASWNFWFGLLDLYAEESNHARVPPASFKTGDGYQLGSWVSDQRKVKQKHKLSDKWNVRLESLSRWVRDVIAFQWNGITRTSKASLIVSGMPGFRKDLKHQRVMHCGCRLILKGQKKTNYQMTRLPGWKHCLDGYGVQQRFENDYEKISQPTDRTGVF